MSPTAEVAMPLDRPSATPLRRALDEPKPAIAARGDLFAPADVVTVPNRDPRGRS